MSFPIVPDLVAYIPSRHCEEALPAWINFTSVIPRGPSTGSS
ncbi:hypothetical protein [Rickettsia asembonensis]|nr:hypothetical protein [Rickettsia asembonensis]